MTEIDQEGIDRVVAMMDTVTGGTRQRAEQIVRAYLTKPELWPADTSWLALIAEAGGCMIPSRSRDPAPLVRRGLREALLHDPVIQAGCELVQFWLENDITIDLVPALRLRNVIDEAGL